MYNNTINIVEFCAGYSGLGLGIKRVLGKRMRVIGYCELEGFAQANLISKMEKGLLDAAPIWPNLLTFPYANFRGLVDFAVAGIPCQPHSNAGKRKGGEDERFLFDDWLQGLSEMQPRGILIENVEGLLSSKMSDGSLCIAWVIERLEKMDYRVEAGIFSASEVGAPHQRKRVFILGMANNNNKGLQGLRECCGSQGWQEPSGHAGGCGEIQIPGVGQADSDNGGSWEDRQPTELRSAGSLEPSCDCGGDCQREGREVSFWPSRPGQPQYAWEPPRTVGNTTGGKDDRRESRDMGEASGEGGCGDNAFGDPSEGVADSADRGLGERWDRSAPALQGQCSERTGEQERSEHSGIISGRSEGLGSLEDTLGAGSGGESGDVLHQGGASGPTGGESLPIAARRSFGATESDDQPASGDGGEEAQHREIEQPVGLHPHGPANWMGLSELSGLSDSELAEIYEWMEKTDNRTDELRMLGNGVVPQTAELAFRTLYAELTGV